MLEVGLSTQTEQLSLFERDEIRRRRIFELVRNGYKVVDVVCNPLISSSESEPYQPPYTALGDFSDETKVRLVARALDRYSELERQYGSVIVERPNLDLATEFAGLYAEDPGVVAYLVQDEPSEQAL